MDCSSPGSPILGLPHCRQFFAILATRKALLGFKLTLNVLPVSALVAFTFRVFSASLFFRGAVIPWVSFFSRLEPCPSWSLEPCLLGTRLRAEEPSPKPQLHPAGEHGFGTPLLTVWKNLVGTLWKNQSHCSWNTLKMKTRQNIHIGSAKLNQLVRCFHANDPRNGGKNDFCLSHTFLGSQIALNRLPLNVFHGMSSSTSEVSTLVFLEGNF